MLWAHEHRWSFSQTYALATVSSLDYLGKLFATDPVAEGCWCMWFIIPVKEYHAAGPQGNRQSFARLAAASDTRMGLLAYEEGEPVGWCAAGPRSRYVRALRTPTYKGRDPAEDDSVWLVPCFFAHKDRRRAGITASLLEAAVRLAREHGAIAVEAFPHASGTHSSQDPQVSSEAVFAALGFREIRTPLAVRVVMRLELTG